MQTYNYLSNELPREIIEVYNDIQSDLLKIIVRELKKGTRPENVYQKLKDVIDEYQPEAQKVLLYTFKDIEKKTIKDNDKEAEQHDEKALNESETNAVFMPLVVGAMALLGNINNKLSVSATNKYAEVYQMAHTGKNGYTSGMEQLQRVYRYLANKGISIYESFGGGKSKNYSVENIIRRDVMSTVNRANSKANMENFKNSSAKFIEVSSHPTARTWNKYMKQPYEDHSSWQGKVYYSKEGEPVEGYKEFESTCGYGEMLGISGINCYHQFSMNYDGESSATQYSEKEVERQYALSQQQRAYERAIRQLKQAKSVYQEAGDEKLAKSIGKNISTATSQLKSFCEKNNLKYYNWRTQI